MRNNKGERLFRSVNHLILIAASLTCLLPLLNLLAVSMSSNDAVLSGKVYIWPVNLTWQSYDILLQGTPIVQSFRNSLIITAGGVALSMLFTFLAAYPLSRKGFYGRKPFTLAIVFTALFNGGLIPLYLLVKSLGLIDSYFAVWFPSLISVYNMLIMKSYLEGLPDELEEAARIDGAGELTFIAKIILPLSVPMLATVSLFYAVALWNVFNPVLIFINDPVKYNLSVLVQQMVRSQSLTQDFALTPEEVNKITPEGVKAAGVMILLLPLLIVYPFIQRFFIKGVTIGAIKG